MAPRKTCRSIPTRGPFDHSHAVCIPYTVLRTSVLRRLALTLANTSRQDNVKVTAEAKTGKTQTLHPSTPVPHLKRRMGFSLLALQFTRLPVSTFHRYPPDAPHYCIATGTRNAPTNPAPPLPLTLFTLCLAVPSTLRPSQRRWKPDANPTLPHRLSCLDRPTV